MIFIADKRLGVKSRTARPSLVGRRARCIKCGRVVKSDWSLDFFEYLNLNFSENYFEAYYNYYSNADYYYY